MTRKPKPMTDRERAKADVQMLLSRLSVLKPLPPSPREWRMIAEQAHIEGLQAGRREGKK